MAISTPLDSTAVAQADDVFYCVHDHMIVGGLRQPLDPNNSDHDDMRSDWVGYYEAILAHNSDGSRPFPPCSDANHEHHDPACTFCQEETEEDEDEDNDEGDEEEGGDDTSPVIPCDNGHLVVKVIDEDGFPIKGAQVDAGSAGAKKSNKDGVADFGHTTPGSYDITATKAAHAPKRGDPEGPDREMGKQVPAGVRTEVELIQNPMCAEVAHFSLGTGFYFGFDCKTNIPVTFKEASAGATPTDGYWDPVPAFGSIKKKKRTTRDGAPWVSLEVGNATGFEINFDFAGAVCIPCIENSTFVVEPSSVAEVVTKKVSSKKAEIHVRGKSEGEASCTVYCDGVEIGWFHIWCKNFVTIPIDVACIKTNMTSIAPYNLSMIDTELSQVFYQAVMDFDLQDLGVIDLSADNWLRLEERTHYDLMGNHWTYNQGFLDTLHTAADASLAARTSGTMPRPNAYRMYFYVPGSTGPGGSVINVGSSPAFVFDAPGPTTSDDVYNAVAHEMGHALGLHHPYDPGITGQLPEHLLKTLLTDIPAQPKKHNEPAVTPRGPKKNIMANDTFNLMGYAAPKKDRKMLRYAQWKALKRR